MIYIWFISIFFLLYLFAKNFCIQYTTVVLGADVYTSAYIAYVGMAAWVHNTNIVVSLKEKENDRDFTLRYSLGPCLVDITMFE